MILAWASPFKRDINNKHLQQNKKFTDSLKKIPTPGMPITFHLHKNANYPVKGSCQVKKNPRKLGLIRPQPPTPYPIFFFWKHLKTLNNTKKNNKKNTTFLEKILIRVGTWPTHPLSSFSRIFF